MLPSLRNMRYYLMDDCRKSQTLDSLPGKAEEEGIF